MRPQLSAPDVDQDYVINMDQTPVYFLMAPRTTLNLMGDSTIHIASTDVSTTRLSVTVGVTECRKRFKPMLTFKGTLFRQVTLKEFPTYTNSDECLLTCPRKVWVDEKLHEVDISCHKELFFCFIVCIFHCHKASKDW